MSTLLERSEPGEIDFLNQYDPELLWEGVPSGLSTHWMPVQSWWKADDELMALFELIKGKVDLFYKIFFLVKRDMQLIRTIKMS